MRRGKADWKPEEERGFDAVIGNPPWVDVQEIAISVSAFLRRRYASAAGKYDLYAVFMELACRLSREGAGFSMITQSKFLVTDYGRSLRGFLAESAVVTSVARLGDAGVFGGVTTYPFILVASRGSATDGQTVHAIILTSGATAEDARTALSGATTGRATRCELPVLMFRTDEPWPIEPPTARVEPTSWVLLCRPLSDVLPDIAYGVKTCLDPAYLGSHAHLLARGVEGGLVRRAVKPRSFKRFEHMPEDLWMVFPYTEPVPGQLALIDLASWPGAARHFAEWKEALGERRFYGKTVLERGMAYYELPYVSSYSRLPKIAFPTVVRRATFYFDASGGQLFIAPCYVIAIPPGVDGSWCTSVLNSGLINFVLARRSTELRGGYMEMQRQYVEELPIRLIDFPNPTPPADKDRLIADCSAALEAGDYDLSLHLAEQALSTHAALHGPAGKPELRDDPYWKAQIAQAAPDFPGREDFVHDLLANLAQRMMDMNKQKHEETQGFLTWLARHINADLETLTNKTKIKAYHEHDLDTLLGILAKNRKKLGEGVDPKSRAFQEAIEAEFPVSVAKVAPLDAKLEATDRLIDQIVYKLYGLTDEEIEIVEGASDGDATG